MSYQEIAKNMIDRLPESQMIFVINMLEGLGELSGANVHPESVTARKQRPFTHRQLFRPEGMPYYPRLAVRIPHRG